MRLFNSAHLNPQRLWDEVLLSHLVPHDFEKVVNFYGWHMPLAEALWLEILDHIHHRGQFSVYLRLAGAKVPWIYGPTADESTPPM